MSGYEPLKDISPPEEGSSSDPKVPSGSNAGPNFGGEEDEFFIAPETLDTKGAESRARSPIRKEPTRKPPKVKNVVVNRNPQNPSREIIVKWDRPEIKGDFYFKVYVEGDTKSKIEFLDSSKQEVCFKELKSDTKYVAFVWITKDGIEGETSTSKPIFTDKALRTQGFRIKEKGKPKITQCFNTSVNGGDGLASCFEWILPDLGMEKNNYSVVGTQALIKEDGDQLHELKTEDDIRAKPVNLKFGTVYEFSVKRTYSNLDKYDVIDATSKQILKTDIGKPEITNVKWHEQQIIVSWKPAKGANKHTLMVHDEAVNFVTQKDAVSDRDITFDMTDSCNYGKICTLVLEASNNKVDKKTESNPIERLIGGESAVTQVVATKCRQRREILVTWNQPKLKPQGYLVQMYEKGRKNAESAPLEQTLLSHKFKELKTDTKYFFKVFPRYGGSARGATVSNEVQTDKREKLAIETEDDFGIPKEIVHVDKSSDSEGLIVMLSWEPRDLGENYKLSKQHLRVKKTSDWNWNATFDKQLSPTQTEVVITGLELGHKYDVKLTLTLIDLDNRKESSKTKDYFFYTNPNKARINDCKYKDGLITFSWGSIKDATKYILEIKDELMENQIANSETIVNGKCEVQVGASERLCIGRTCATRVTSYVNDLSSESDWKLHLIGGILVPRNVKASRNSENPKRSVLVTFDAPKKGPAQEYKITAKPEYGKKKFLLSNTNTVLFEYLRKGIRYSFEVCAKHDGKWSDDSPSNYQETDRDDANIKPPVGFNNVQGTVNLQYSNIQGSTATVNLPKGEGYGKVRDLTPTLNLPVKYAKENLTLSWKVPSFDQNAFDYKVERYNVEIRKMDSNKCVYEFPIEFEKKLDKYSTEPRELELGILYEVSVSTTYTAIDEDEEHTSSAEKKNVQTRPCAPTGVRKKIDKNKKGEEVLKIEWNAATGAESYEIAIYTDKEEAFKKVNTGKDTKWIQTFDDSFGFGTSFHAVITSIGGENKKNSFTTAAVTIGGDYSPKKMHADIKHDKVVDPNTQVYLTWEPPTKLPDSYQVSYEESGKPVKISCKETNCLVEGLKAGEYYTFKVIAIHSSKQSGGCFSNSIQTNPTPTKVKNLLTSPGHNPCTSIKIHWDKVEAEKKNESTIYRVTVTAVDNGSRRQINNIEEESICVSGLESGTKYFTTVAGGNSIGFGEESEKCYFETDLGTPKNVQLSNNTTSPSTSLILKFSNAEGKPKKYICVHKGEQTSTTIDDVQSGHVINDLEPNTDYYVLVYAVFQNEKEGQAVKSEVILTAPSKPEILKSQCCVDAGILSSKDLILKWKLDIGCTEHEIQIKHGEEVENQLTVKNKNELRYSCQYEASRYTARVRSKNHLFGPWSDEKVIDLAPMKLINATAELEKDGSDIIVKCKKMASECLSYFCQAFCNNQCTGDPVVILPKDVEDTVMFKFEPTEHAKKYSFKLWVVDNKELKGDSVFTGVVISRPAPGKLLNLEKKMENQNMDIAISWEVFEGCDEYEVKIKKSGEQKYEKCIRTTETNCDYRCQCPGSKYGVRVRGICSSVRGNWSEKKLIELVPAEVELKENGDEHEPVESVQLTWKQLEPKPSGYNIILYQGEKKVKEKKTENNQHTFEGVTKSGFVYHCTVAGYNDAGNGKLVKTRNYRIKWNIPNLFQITHDENDPSRRAKLSWDRPDGVNCFRLEIENNQMGTVISMELTEEHYVFESGTPGSSYSVRLYCGCDGHFDSRCVKEKIAMKPEPPTNLKAVADIKINGIIVTFKENSNQQRSYEVCAKRQTEVGEKEDVTTVTTTQERALVKKLIPGATYEVSITSIANNERSKKFTLEEFIQTFPDSVKNLLAKVEDGIITYTWDPMPVVPDEYIVYWKVDNVVITEESTNVTTFTKRLVKGAQTYELGVAASNSSRKGKITRQETFIPVPGSVKNLLANVKDGIITYTWDPIPVMPDEYIIYWKVDNVIMTEESTNETTITKKLVKGAQAYELGVAASNSSGEGKILKLETCIPVPDVVKNLFANIENGILTYTWDPILVKPDEYIVFWKVDNVIMTEESTNETTLTKRLVKGAQAYELGVAASNGSGKGKITRLETFIPVLDGVKNLVSKVENGIITYTWDPMPVVPDEYSVYWKVDNVVITEESTNETTFTKRLVKGAQTYELGVAASNSSGKGKITRLETFIPVPDEVKNIHSKEQNAAIVYEWDALEIPPDEYIVQWRVNNEDITEERTEETKFEIRFLEPAHSYNFRVMASNIAGNGKMSKWNTFITRPMPPRGFQVKLDEDAPMTRFIVKIEDDPHPSKKYLLTVTGKVNGEEIIVRGPVETQNFVNKIGDLDPGRSYFFKVQTDFCGEKSTEKHYYAN